MAGLLDLIYSNQSTKTAPARVSAKAAEQTAQMAPLPSTIPQPNPQFDSTQTTPGALTDEQTASMNAPTPAATFGAGIDQTAGMVKNALAGAAQAVGASDVNEMLLTSASRDEAAAQRKMALSGSVNSLRDISKDNLVGDTMNFLGHSIVRNAPQLGAMAAGSILTRGAGRFGQALGTAAPSAVLNFGDTYGEGIEGAKTPEQRDAALTHAAAVAPVMAALDTAGFNTIFKAGGKKALADTITASLPAHIRKSIVTEGLTEGVQEYIQQAAVKHALDNPDVFGIDKDTAWRLADATAAGAASGGAFAPLGHAAAPAAAAARMVNESVVDPAIALAGRALNGDLQVPNVKQYIPDVSNTGAKAGAFVRNLIDGDPAQAGQAAMDALSNIPGLGAAIEQGADFLDEVRKSKRIARAEAAWSNAEETLQRGFENFYTGLTEQIDPATAQQAYGRYKEMVAAAMPITDAKASGEKLATALNSFNAALARNAPAVKSIFGNLGKTAKNLGSAAADIGAMAAPVVGAAATGGAKAAEVGSRAAAAATHATRETLKEAGGYSGVGEKIKTAYDEAVADVVGRWRTGKATAEDVAKTVATQFGPDEDPVPTREANAAAAQLTDNVRGLLGDSGTKKSVTSSPDAQLIAKILKQLAPNLSDDSARVQARVFEALVNNPTKMDEFLAHPQANTLTANLYNIRAGDLSDLLVNTLRDKSAESTNDSLGYLGAPPGESAFEARSTQPKSGAAKTLVSGDEEDAYAGLRETQAPNPDAYDTSVDVPGSGFENQEQGGVSKPAGPPNEQLRFMEKALYDPSDKEREKLPGSKQWVKVTKREIDANTGAVLREHAFDRKVNLADLAIAESKTGARTQASDAGLTLAQKKDRNFQEGLGRLFGEPVVDVDPKTGNKIEYSVQPARQNTEDGKVVGIPKDDLQGWLRPDSKVAADGRSFKQMESDTPKPKLGLPSAPMYVSRMLEKLAKMESKNSPNVDSVREAMSQKAGKEAVKTLYNIRPDPETRDRVDVRTEKNIALDDSAAREHRTSTPRERLNVIATRTRAFIESGVASDAVDDFWQTLPHDQRTMSAMDEAIRTNDPSVLPDLIAAEMDPRALLAVQLLPSEVLATAGDVMTSTLDDIVNTLNAPSEPTVDEGAAAETKEEPGPVKDSLSGEQITYATPKASEKAALRKRAEESKDTAADLSTNVDKTGQPVPPDVEPEAPLKSELSTAVKPVKNAPSQQTNNPQVPAAAKQAAMLPGGPLLEKSVVKANREAAAAAPEVAAKSPKGQPAPSGREVRSAKVGAGPDIDLTTEAGQALARQEIKKIAGDVKVEFASNVDYAGSYDPEGHLVTLSVNHSGALGTAYHEALHAIFKALAPNDKRELYKALNTITVRQKLLKLLSESPEAMDAVRSDPEELAAYAFQFWKLGHLELNPVASHWLERIQQAIQRVWQWVRGQATANELFDRIAEGFYAEGKDAAARAVLQLERTKPAIQQVVNSVARGYERLWDVVCATMDDRLRQTGNSEMNQIAQLLYTRVGERNDERGLAQAIPQRSKKFLNELGSLLGSDPVAADAALHALARGESGGAIGQRIQGFLKRMYVYQREAGMDIGYVPGYLPMQWSGDKIGGMRFEFLELMRSHQADIDKLNEELRQRAGNPAHFKELTPESITDMMENRNKTKSIPEGDVYDEFGVPTDHHAAERVFKFLTNAEREPFVEDNLLGTMTQYVKQAVKRAEYVRRFGERSEKLSDLMERAHRGGVTNEQLQLVRDSLNNIYNVRYLKMNPELRKAMGIAQVYQNFRVLGLALFSSVIDPLVLAVRTQEFGEAWGAYKAAVKGFLPKSRSELDQLAEDIGAIEQDGVMDSIVDMYGGFEVEGMIGKANEKLFTYNGMNGLTRSLRVYATGAGIRFIMKHATAGNERMLRELGLNQGDVHFMPDGQLAYRGDQFRTLGFGPGEATTKARKVQDALNRFVDESVLRPNAQERPNWGSDPLWGLVFHLKQYLFSFNKTVTAKVMHEVTETGSPHALLTAAPFIPVMAASSMMRDMIQYAGNIPAERGLLYYLGQGWQRSGFEGPATLPFDVARDVMAGHSGIGAVGGPTLDQTLGFMEAIGSNKGTKTVGDWVEQALPLSSIYKRW